MLATLRSGNYVLGAPVEAFEADFAALLRHASTRSRSAPAPRRCTWRCWPPGSGRGTRSSPCPRPSSPPWPRSSTPARAGAGRHRPGDLDAWIRPLIAAAITPRTKAILPVHLHGRLADMAAILRDRAAPRPDRDRGCGAGPRGRAGRRAARAASATWAASASIPGKNLGACGEGGAVTTDDAELAATAALPARLGAGGQVQPRPAGLQLPHGRGAGRGSGRQAAPSGRLERRPPPGGEAYDRPASARDRARRSGRSAPTTPATSMPSPRRPRRAARGAGSGRHRDGHPLPGPVHLQPGLCRAGLRPRRFPGGRGLCRDAPCRCRSIPELTDAQEARGDRGRQPRCAGRSPETAERGSRA